MKRSKWSQLLDFYTRNINQEPARVEPYLQRGHFYFEHNELELAIADFSLAIDLNPSRCESYNSRALVYSKKELFQQALYDFNSALKINPHDPLLYVNRGVAYNHNRQYLQAISDYNQAICLWMEHFKYPQNLQRWRAYKNRALAQCHLENYKQCLLDTFRAMVLVPQQRRIHTHIAQFYAEFPQDICLACLGEKINGMMLKRLQSLHEQFSLEVGKRKELFQELLLIYVQTGKANLVASLRNYQRKYLKD